MIPILYEATETNFTSNGVCRLAEATECHVIEERNGEYELTLTYPITGKYYDQIQEGMYIAATHDDKSDRQAFQIYRRSAPFNGLVQFFARHISYHLNNVILNPITATSAADAFDQMETDTVTANPFTMWTDVTSSGDFESKTPVSIRNALGGKRGSILDVYGGEYEWDMFTVKLHAQRGLDTDVTIRYGKNLTDLNQVIDAGGIYNAIVPYWLGTENDEDVLVTLPEHYVAATGVTNPVMVPMDFSSEFQDKPTVAELRSAASSFLSSNQPWIPSENIKISFVQLWQTEEYKDVAVLQRLSLCDRVNVYYPALGITAEGVKIIKTNYNVLLDRYDEMELGDARSSFADTLINPLENAITEATQSSISFFQKAIDHVTKMITGGFGSHIEFMYDANGKFTEILAMDTEDPATAVHVLRINVNGIGFSSTGVNGPFTTAWTLDGQFVADFITAGTMLANRIKGGTLSLGGVDNGNGVLHVYDASGNLIGKWDKDGIIVNRGTIRGPYIAIGGSSNADGILEIYDSLNSRVGRWDNGALYIGNIASSLLSPNTKIDTAGAITTNSLTANSYVRVDGNYNSYLNIPLSASNSNYYTRMSKDGITMQGIGNSLQSKLRLGPVEFGSGNMLPTMYLDGNSDIELYVSDSDAYLNLSHSSTSLEITSSRLSFVRSGVLETNVSWNGIGVVGSLDVLGSFTATGSKNRLVSTKDYGERCLYAYETPSPMFGDVGEGVIAEDKKCYVFIDPIYSETVSLNQYQVFLQKYGEGECFVSRRTPSYFIVEGTPNLSFGWEIQAKQHDFDQRRLDVRKYRDVEIEDAIDYPYELETHIADIKSQREVA